MFGENMDLSLERCEKEVKEVVFEEEGWNFLVGQNEFALIWKRDEFCL